jgi:putative SOS response-associated peptidase YedK
MCGRFALISPGDALIEQFGLNPEISTSLSSLSPRYNIAPTQPIAAIRLTPDQQSRELTFFRWGLIPSWAKDMKMSSRMINARSETVAEKPSFRAAFKRRRCLIPADGFYEWQRQGSKKQPMYIHARNQELFALAGLWETWHAADGSVIESCTILTTQPNELIKPIHNRMPVIIEPPDYSLWLNPEPQPDRAMHLLRPYPADQMAAHAVSTVVNNVRNDTPECIAPLA